MAEINTLGWFDYLVIAIMLCICAGIGIYYRFSGGRQKTMEVIIIILDLIIVNPCYRKSV